MFFLVSTVGGAHRQAVHQTGETETNNASPQREDPAFADCAHGSQCVYNIRGNSSHTIQK